MAARLTVNLNVKGAPGVAAALNAVKDAVQNRVVKAAIGVVARRAAKTVKEKSPRGPTGAYKAAIGTKYKSYRKGKVWTYVVGARKDVTRPNPRPHGPPVFVAHKYAHLIEGGRRPVQAVRANFLKFYPRPKGNDLVFRKAVRGVSGKYPVRTAYEWVAGPGAAVAANEIEPRLLREIEKAAAKGKSVGRGP